MLLFFLTFPLLLIPLVSLLAETNRSLFHFIERDSELVSGFYIDYRRGRFNFIFFSLSILEFYL